jgi:hypothetical protein
MPMRSLAVRLGVGIAVAVGAGITASMFQTLTRSAVS